MEQENNFNSQVTNLGNVQGNTVGSIDNTPQTISLNNLQQENLQANAQVVNPTTTAQINNFNVTEQPVNSIPQPVNEVVTTEHTQNISVNEPVVDDVEQPINIQPIIQDEFIIDVKLLKRLVSSAKKVGIYDAYIPQSQVLNISLDRKGITLNTSNGDEDYECVDTTYQYTDILKAAVDINKFSELILALDTDTVKLSIGENNSLVVNTGNGSFKFAERVDSDVGQPIISNLRFRKDYEELVPLDYNKLLEIINHTKPVRSFASSMETMMGIYFTDIVICSDTSIILMQENSKELVNGNFFLNSRFCDVLNTLDFNVANCRIGFNKNELGNTTNIIISDGRLTICGNVDSETGLPLDICREYWKQEFGTTVTMDTNKCLNVLKRVKPFVVNGQNTDKTTFAVVGNTLKVISLQGDATDSLDVQNSSSYNGSFELPFPKIFAVLQTINSPTFNLTLNKDINNCIGLEFDGFKCIIGLT